MNRLFTIAGLALAFLVMVWAFMPDAIQVETAHVARGEFKQFIEDDGKTRPRNVYVISSPVKGNLLRVRLKAGDPVQKDQVVAKIIPATSPPLDIRESLQLEEQMGAAQSALLRAKVIADRAKASYDNAQIDFKRSQELAQKGFVSKSELDKQQLEMDLRKKEHQSALLNIEAAEHDLKRTEYALKQFKRAYEPESESNATIELNAPIHGEVIKLDRESEGAIMAGDKILEIADSHDIEIVSDILSTDAVKIPPHAPVVIKRWGGKADLTGQVRRVEPGGFTKLSALGVEEQRVNVIIDITSPESQWQSLRAGFQLDTEIVLYTLADQVLAPVSALFRHDKAWAVFVVENNHVSLRTVEVEDRNNEYAIITKGLEPGERVIIYPGDRIKAGIKVKTLTTSPS